MANETEKPTGLALLRAPFEPNQISKLPKPTKAQSEAVKADYKKGIRCKLCGGWHHPDVVHLDYVGHAALTDRLLDCDPEWNWEPLAVNGSGAPALDENGGMWIRLTVCGVSRLGYGHPDGKRGGDAIKEVIGDALRNAAMRFGAALDLWHKGVLHADEPGDEQSPAPARQAPPKPQSPHTPKSEMLDWEDLLPEHPFGKLDANASKPVFKALQTQMQTCQTSAELHKWASDNAADIWSMAQQARHFLRERFDTLNESLPETYADVA